MVAGRTGEGRRLAVATGPARSRRLVALTGPASRHPVTAACLAAWTLLTALAVGRAVARSWYPLGDQALIAVRAGDVLTRHHPLLGTAASVALGEGRLTNHPGPLLFHLVAVPVRLLGAGAGLALGVALVNLAAGIVAIVFAHRRGGQWSAASVGVALAVLVSSYGNHLVVEPYNPTVSMLAFFTVLVLGWSLVDGDRWAAPWLVGWASFCLQTNLAYTIVVVPFLLAIATWVVVRTRRAGRAGGAPPPSRRPAIAAFVVGTVVWLPPLIEQVLHGRRGNLALLARAVGATAAPLGWRDGTRHAAGTLTLWPAWGPGSFTGYSLLDPPPGFAVAFASLVALVAILVALVLALRRAGRTASARLAALAAATVVLGWLAAIQVPVSPLFGYNADYVRWLWPIGAFAALAVVLGAGALIGPVLRSRGLAASKQPDLVRRSALALATVAAMAVAVPPGPDRGGDGYSAEARVVARRLADAAVPQLAGRRVLWDPQPPRYPIVGLSFVARLREAGVTFAVEDPIAVRQFGPRRAATADEVDAVFAVAVGWEAVARRDGAVAVASSRSPDEVDELAALLATFRDAFDRGDVSLTPRGEEIARSLFGRPWMLELLDAGRLAPDVLYDNSETIVRMLEQGHLRLPAPLDTGVARFVELSRGVHTTVAAVVWV